MEGLKILKFGIYSKDMSLQCMCNGKISKISHDTTFPPNSKKKKKKLDYPFDYYKNACAICSRNGAFPHGGGLRRKVELEQRLSLFSPSTNTLGRRDR